VSDFGFVYILTNEAMSVFKVGCTERSPHTRADELSKPSGVPLPFKVAMYAEFSAHQAEERAMHKWLEHARINDAREFFWASSMEDAVRFLYWHPRALSVSIVDKHLNAAYDYESPERNPWAKRPAVAEPSVEAMAALDSLADETDAFLAANAVEATLDR